MMELVDINSLGLFDLKILSVRIGFTLMLVLYLTYMLSSNAITWRRDISLLFIRILIIMVLYLGFLVLRDFSLNSLNKGLALYNGLYNTTLLSHTFHFFLCILSFFIVLVTGFYPRKVWSEYFASVLTLLMQKFIYTTRRILNKTAKLFRIIEYPLLIIFTVLGGFFIMNSNDLVSIFLSLELQSYGLYIISTLHRNSELSTLGGLTYFLLGSLSSCFILLGSATLYISYGSTFLEGLYIVSNISYSVIKHFSANIWYWYKHYHIHISLLILSVGLLFKVSAAPFHFWSPDVYDAIPTLITMFVAIIGKLSIFILLLELVHFTSKALFAFYNYTWKTSLLVSSILSLIIGTIAGLTQFRIKRLYAYSTISHVGYILLALSINSIESIQAFIFYIISYSISNLNAFILLLSIGFSFYFLTEKQNISYKANNLSKLENYNLIKLDKNYKHFEDKNNSPVQYISQLKGYFYINPFLALSLTITLFSFVGVPPLLGFFGKQMVLSAALDKGYFFIALIAILTSVISAVYYLQVVKQIFFYKPDSNNLDVKSLKLFAHILKKNIAIKKVAIEKIVLSSSLTIVISIFTLIILSFTLISQESINMTNIISLIIFKT